MNLTDADPTSVKWPRLSRSLKSRTFTLELEPGISVDDEWRRLEHRLEFLIAAEEQRQM